MKITNTVKSKALKSAKPGLKLNAKPAAKRAAVPQATKKIAPKVKPLKVSAPKAKRAITPLPVQQITTDQIASRAYSIWEQQGRPAGKESEHWFQAEQQLKSSQSFTE
jgi:H+-transporting ATPase